MRPPHEDDGRCSNTGSLQQELHAQQLYVTLHFAHCFSCLPLRIYIIRCPHSTVFHAAEIPIPRFHRFATDARAFEQLCHRLERRGIASVVVPIRWYHWLPTLGGRSVRPILDRIHETVIRYLRDSLFYCIPFCPHLSWVQPSDRPKLFENQLFCFLFGLPPMHTVDVYKRSINSESYLCLLYTSPSPRDS